MVGGAQIDCTNGGAIEIKRGPGQKSIRDGSERSGSEYGRSEYGAPRSRVDRMERERLGSSRRSSINRHDARDYTNPAHFGEPF